MWGASAHEAPVHANLLLWEGPCANGEARLIVDYLDANADEVRARYLAWVQDLGDLVVREQPLRERFAFADGVNLWALSVFVEQSPWRQKSVEPILKVMAFELLLERESPGSVRYNGPDEALSRVLAAVCLRRGVAYEATLMPSVGATERESLRRRLPQALQGLLGLGYLALTRLPLRRPSRLASAGGRQLLICAPFFNNNAREAGVRDFESRFWTVLPATLEAGGYSIAWLHSFYAHEAVPGIAEAQRQIRQVNESTGSHGAHLLLESFLTLRGFLKIAYRAFVAAVRSLASERELRTHVPYWPLMKADWAKAFRGAGCVENLLYSECFDQALAFLPRQDQGLYLMECQGWERALCHAWRRRGHGNLAGSIHSTIRYWDLRYHCDPRRYGGKTGRLPAPDVVVVNGHAAERKYHSTCASREDVFEAEALRYLHLGVPVGQELPSPDPVSKTTVRILVVGDYLREGTDSVMRLIEQACAERGEAVEIRVKPHPNCPVDPHRFPALRFTVTTGDVSALARDAHLVISGNLTSAAVDAYVAGARLLVHDDGRGLNYSPLRGEPGVTFIRNAAQLRAVLDELPTSPAGGEGQTDFFHIETGLPRWQRYFGITKPQ